MTELILIGDSIRMGYQETVQEALRDTAEIWAPSENGGTSANVLAHLDEWVIDRQPACVHINCGLHDLARAFGEPGHRVELEDYQNNVCRIVDEIRSRTHATVLWATTTPINQAWHHANKGFDRFEADVVAYNAAAWAALEAFKVPVNDLYAYVQELDCDTVLVSDGVHFTPEGYTALGEQVAAFIRPHLGS